MGLLIILYLVVIIASHSVPLSSALEEPLALGGWLAFLVLLFLDRRNGNDGVIAIAPSGMRWSWVPHLVFAVVAGLAFYFASTGNLSLDCPDHATSCVKIDQWRMSSGHYYRQFPYDSQGNGDAGAPWVEISRQEYVAEVGTRLRQATQFGVGLLCVAWMLSGGLNAIRRKLLHAGHRTSHRR
jgi:hypothetical protein